MDGSEKLPILVIGKSRKPKCFRNVKSLPCDYESNKDAWMTVVIYEAYLKRLSDKIRKAKRKIVIFVDNCAAYSKDSNSLSNIKVYFSPSNFYFGFTTDGPGVINVFKQYYRKQLVKCMIEKLDNTEELRKGNILESIHFILSAWR